MVTIKSRVVASLNDSFSRFCSWSSVKTGTNAALRAASANSERTTFGIWNASVNALAAVPRPKNRANSISLASPATREAAVRIEKIAVLRANDGRRRTCSSWAWSLDTRPEL